MKKATLLVLALAISFSFGFAFRTFITKQSDDQTKIKKVTLTRMIPTVSKNFE